MSKVLLALLLLIPSLSWGLTFKDGKQVDEGDTTISINEEVTESSRPMSIFISDSELNDFLNLSQNHKMKVCGFNYFIPDWKWIDKNLADKISGYNSRMDNSAEGEYSKEVYRRFAEVATYAYVSNDLEIKERLFEKLYQWSVNEALLETTICYNRNRNDKIRPHCKGEWSDPNGQDLAPIKDASVSLDIGIGLNYIYQWVFADYKRNDPRHSVIKDYLKEWEKRTPLSDNFFWGLQIGWFVPEIYFRHQNNQNYTSYIKKMLNGANRWMNNDGSLKERTTRGNRALWYHHTAVAEAFLAMEIAKANNVELPKGYEEKFLNAVDLFYRAYLDNSYITKWAKKSFNAQFDKNNPDNQIFAKYLARIEFGGYWFWGFQYRYPDHPFSKYLLEELRPSAENLKSDTNYGIGLGCIYNALSKPVGLDKEEINKINLLEELDLAIQ